MTRAKLTKAIDALTEQVDKLTKWMNSPGVYDSQKKKAKQELNDLMLKRSELRKRRDALGTE